MITNIHALDRIRQQCRRGTPLSAELNGWLADALGRYLEQECETLNEAFGIVQARGGLPWWRERAIRERDASLRALDQDHFDGWPLGDRVREIVRISTRYAADCWPRDWANRQMPPHYLGTPNQHLWQAFKSRAKMPLTERHLRTLLG